MITKMFLEVNKQIQGHKRTYIGGPDGLVNDIDQGDFPALLAGGALPCVIPKTINLAVSPEQVLHYASGLHTADKHGIIADVPWDDAVIMINDQAHPARLASDQEMIDAGYLVAAPDADVAGHLVDVDADELGELRAAAARGDSIFKALSEKFGGAEIVDTGDVSGPHEDMIFKAERDGVELARGTATELFQHVVPAPTSALADTAPAETVTPPIVDADDAVDLDEEGDLLAEVHAPAVTGKDKK